MYNQEDYQIVVDKKSIANLEREIEVLKWEIFTKNEIIKKIFSNDICQKNAAIWWGKHGTLMLLTKQKIISGRAVQVTQKVL